MSILCGTIKGSTFNVAWGGCQCQPHAFYTHQQLAILNTCYLKLSVISMFVPMCNYIIGEICHDFFPVSMWFFFSFFHCFELFVEEWRVLSNICLSLCLAVFLSFASFDRPQQIAVTALTVYCAVSLRNFKKYFTNCYRAACITMQYNFRLVLYQFFTLFYQVRKTTMDHTFSVTN